MHPDRFLNKPLPTQGETLLVSPYVQPVIMVDPGTFGLPGSGPVMRPLVNTSGQVTEVSGANISQYTSQINATTRMARHNSKASGGLITHSSTTTPGWVALPPLEAVADGAGAVAAIAILAAVAAQTHDIEIYLHFSTAGAYLLDWADDPGGGAEAPTIPDYHTAPVPVTVVAGDTLGPFRIEGSADNLAMGWATMPNGSWPNDAQVVITGDRREV